MRTTKIFKFSLVALTIFILATIALFEEEVPVKAAEVSSDQLIDMIDLDVKPVETKEITTDTPQVVAVEETTPQEETHIYTWDDVQILARTAWGECRGMYSKTEISCVMWCILNRLDHGGYGYTVRQVATAPNQFYYKSYFPMVNDYGIDLVWLADNVLRRWENEKINNVQDPGRTLPRDYMWYAGRNGHNYFRNQYRGGSYYTYWLGSPYDT